MDAQTRHTPGPWETKNGHSVIHVYGGGHRVAVVSEVPYWMDFSITDAANAQLIAAAPDLLAALEEVVAISDRKHDAWDKARAAIAKAKSALSETQNHE